MSDEIRVVQQFDLNESTRYPRKDDTYIESHTAKIKFHKDHRPKKEDFELAVHIYQWCVLHVQGGTTDEEKKEIKDFLHGWVDEL